MQVLVNTYFKYWSDFSYFQGTKLEVRGLQNTPRHVDVPIQQCKDADNFKYPNGLVCAGEACKLHIIVTKANVTKKGRLREN